MTTSTLQSNTPEPLVYTKALLPKIVGLSKATIDNLRKTGDFPHPKRLAGRKVGWPVEEIRAWLASRPISTGLD